MKRALVWTAMLLLAACMAPAVADSVHGPALVVTDTATDFRAIGSLTTVDTSNPVNGVGGTFLRVESPANPNWSFEIGHITAAPAGQQHYQQVNRDWFVKGVGIQIQGGRAGNIGHIATPHAGEAANVLQLATSRQRDLEVGGRPREMTTGGLLGHNQHFDTYTINARVGGHLGAQAAGAAAPGPPNLLTGGFEIVGLHRQQPAPPKSSSEEGSFYSGPESGSAVSFDANTGELKLHVGRINGLDFQGGRLGGVASEYAGDALLRAEWTVTPIRRTGESEGVHKFGGGEITVTDPEDRFSLRGRFESFHVGDSTAFPTLESFGVLTSWEVDRPADGCCGSPFLTDFVRRNLLGHGMSEADWRRWNGIDLAFVTRRDLAEATRRFTRSVDRLPATIYLTLNLKPEGEHEEQEPVAEEQQEAAKPQRTEAEKAKDDLESLADRLGDFIGRVFPGTQSTDD